MWMITSPVSSLSFILTRYVGHVYVRRRRFVSQQSLLVKNQNSNTSRLQIPHTTDPQYFIIYKNLRDVWIPTLALQGRAAWPGACCRHWLCSAASRARRLSVCRGGHWPAERPEHPAWPSDCDLAVCREPADTLMQPGHSDVKVSSRHHQGSVSLPPRLQVTIHTRPHIVDWRQHKVRCGPHWLLQSLMTLSGPGRGLHLRGVIITQNCVCMSAAVCTVCSIIMSVASVSPSGQCRSVVTCCDPERRGVCCLQCGNRGTQTITAQTVTKVRRNILILRKHQRQSQLWWASVRSRN